MIRHIILINGLGTNRWFYHTIAYLWSRKSVHMHFFWFDWDDSTETYEQKIQRLETYCRRYPLEQVALIGVSAGGSAAVNLFQRMPALAKVATISAPYYLVGPVKSQLLRDSMAELEATFTHSSPSLKARLLSVHAQYDTTVGVKQSQPPGVKHVVLPHRTHVRTIFFALTFQAAPIRRFFGL